MEKGKEDEVPFSLSQLRVVPGLYEPVFNLDEFPERVYYLFDSKKTAGENNENRRRYVERSLAQAAQVTLGQAKMSNQSETEGKIKAKNDREKQLLNELRASPLRQEEILSITGLGDPASEEFFGKIKNFREAHEQNMRVWQGIATELEALKTECDKKASVENDGLAGFGVSTSTQSTYPPHYDTFFPEDGSLQTQLASFFNDYSEPTVSSHNQNAIFLWAKKQSRHYVTEANDLVAKINAIQTIAAPGVQIIYQGRDINSPDDQLREVLQAARAELVKKTEGRWTQSHLLRRIDFALEKIAERNRPKPTIEGTLSKS